ncbi:MAG: c-type cytochrome [Pseudomonadales bacterium]|nr:c-type cytochrome [Pseudomonadales bacterium]
MLKIFSRTLVLITGLSLSGLVFAAGDPAAGKDQSIACAACHGQDGATGLDGTYPNLAGQNEKYLLQQLKLIQSGERPILLMSGQLTGKSEQTMADMAAYYASLPAKTGQASGSDEDIAKAQQIYRGGIASKSVAACSACHSPTGVGNAQAGFPRISGQPPEYTTVQLTAYRESQRSSDEYVGGMMRDVAHGLTDGEIAVLADYLQGLN